MRLKTLILTTVLLIACGAWGMDTGQRIFHPSFRSLQVIPETDPQAPAVIMAGMDGGLTISFDELAESPRYLRYSLTHCNADWQPSQLTEPEYIDGFNEATIDDVATSRATTVHYVSYRLTLPDERMPITASGNYLLRVYDEETPDETLLQARFAVCESSMSAQGSLTTRTDIDYNEGHQQLTIDIDTRHAGMSDPLADLCVRVSQNSREDNTVVLTQPMKRNGTTVSFQHDPKLIFPAGNEYRRFETVTTQYPSMGIDRVEYDPPYYVQRLHTDFPRSESPYTYDRTQHGRFTVRSSQVSDSRTEADYHRVVFSLEMPELTGSDLHVEGDLTGRLLDETSRMTYNHRLGRYELELLLKQGAYDYQYLAVPCGSAAGRSAEVEGNRHQTSNLYTVMIYYRRFGERYDRLGAVTVISSNP